MNSTFTLNPKEVPLTGGLHCPKDALTDVFGVFLQILLACLAFTCLIVKRFCEPRPERRSWLIWFFDTSKQGMGAITERKFKSRHLREQNLSSGDLSPWQRGCFKSPKQYRISAITRYFKHLSAMVIHLANVWLSEQYYGDPCTWYLINFLLDSTLGLFIVFIGIRISQYSARKKHWEYINFGEYGIPPSANAWMTQCCLYVVLMVIVKILITLFMGLNFWENVKDFILSPVPNPKVELALVMVVIPFFVNMLIFWVTDNFLMYKKSSRYRRRNSAEQSLLQRAKVKKRYFRKKKTLEEPESDGLISGDDELLDSEYVSVSKVIVT